MSQNKTPSRRHRAREDLQRPTEAWTLPPLPRSEGAPRIDAQSVTAPIQFQRSGDICLTTSAFWTGFGVGGFVATSIAWLMLGGVMA